MALTDVVSREGPVSTADLGGVALASEVAQTGAVHGEVGAFRGTPVCDSNKRGWWYDGRGCGFSRQSTTGRGKKKIRAHKIGTTHGSFFLDVKHRVVD